MESKTRFFLGTIIVVSSIGMILLNYLTNGNNDSYIMPFILLCFSIIVFFTKPKKEETQKKISKTQKNVILPIASVASIAGIITFFTTLF